MNISYKKSNIFFETRGQGPALVLLHGFTESSKIWEHFSRELSAEFQVITIDLPGHGQSQDIAEVHSMELMAEVVKEVLVHLEIQSCVIVGHSMGGYVTLNFVKQFPEMVKGFGLFHSTSLADNEETQKKRAQTIEIIKRNHSDFLLSFIPDLFSPDNRARLQSSIDELIARARDMSPRSLIAAQKGMKERSSTLDVLINTDLPVMFIAGQKDTRVPFENIWVQMALTETAHSLILRSTGHMGFLEEPVKTLEFTRSFARSCFMS